MAIEQQKGAALYWPTGSFKIISTAMGYLFIYYRIFIDYLVALISTTPITHTASQKLKSQKRPKHLAIIGYTTDDTFVILKFLERKKVDFLTIYYDADQLELPIIDCDHASVFHNYRLVSPPKTSKLPSASQQQQGTNNNNARNHHNKHDLSINLVNKMPSQLFCERLQRLVRQSTPIRKQCMDTGKFPPVDLLVCNQWFIDLRSTMAWEIGFAEIYHVGMGLGGVWSIHWALESYSQCKQNYGK